MHDIRVDGSDYSSSRPESFCSASATPDSVPDQDHDYQAGACISSGGFTLPFPPHAEASAQVPTASAPPAGRPANECGVSPLGPLPLDPLSLHLFHHFLTSTVPTLALSPPVQSLWLTTYSRLALHPRASYLLHAILSISALHLASCSSSSQDARRWYIVASTHHDATLRLYRGVVAAYISQDLHGGPSAPKLLEAIIATGSALAVWGFASRATSFLTAPAAREGIPDGPLLPWLPLMRGTPPLVALSRPHDTETGTQQPGPFERTGTLRALSAWLDVDPHAPPPVHPYTAQLAALDQVFQEPPAAGGGFSYAVVPVEALRGAAELVRRGFSGFFGPGQQEPMLPASYFAAVAPEDFVLGLGVRIDAGGDGEAGRWRGDPRALVVMAYQLVMMGLVEEFLRWREKRGGDAVGLDWWCRGLARLEMDGIVKCLVAVDDVEGGREMGTERSGKGRWRRWVDWPVEMIRGCHENVFEGLELALESVAGNSDGSGVKVGAQ